MLYLARFDNGCLVAICEGGTSRIGGVCLSLKTGVRPTTSSIIPSKYGSVACFVLCEALATLTNGIGILSLSVTRELDSDAVKTLLGELKNLVAGEKRSSGNSSQS